MAGFRDSGSPQAARSWRRTAFKLSVFAGIAVLGVFWGSAVAVAGWNAPFLCVAMIGGVFILYDFRIGVVLLILLMPISNSHVFPHAMFGVTGLNPLNLMLVATLGSCLLHGLFNGTLNRFMPRPLLWLYVVPILVAGALGSRHVGDIAPFYHILDYLHFHNAAGYVRDVVAKPMLWVIFALLVAAAVAKSEKPENFLVPTLISMWVLGSVVIIFVYLSGIGIGQLASSDSRGVLSALGLGMHANELGRLYGVAYALLLFTWRESKDPRLRLALLASMGLMIVALILTFSRGAFLAFIVVNALFLMWRVNAKTLVFVGLLAAFALLVVPGVVYERMTAGFGSGLNAITAGRLEGLWLPLLPEIVRSPLYGNGLGSILWSEAMRRADGVAILATTHPHNAYLQALLDMGIAGVILICAYFVHVWKGFRALSVDPALSPTLRGFYLGAAAGLVSFLVAAVFDSSLAPRPEQAFLWLAIGMMYGQRAQKRAR